jgi:hypothetical protein
MRPTRATLALMAAPILLIWALLYLGPAVRPHFCDGAYQRWQIPDDYDGGGCAAITPEWHRIFPWNWGDDEVVCIGLCSDVPMWTPED